MNKYLQLMLMLIILHSVPAYGQISNLITPVSYCVHNLKQLYLLHEAVSKYKKASIIGTSGVGSTQLARIYAYENKHRYNLIWFIDGNLDLNQEFIKLAQQLNKLVDAKLLEEAPQAAKAVIDYLAKQKRWLLVLDNLKVNQHKMIQSLAEQEHDGQVIFCSSNDQSLPNAVAMTQFDYVDTLTLAKNVLVDKNHGDLDFLTTAFNDHPALIVQGAQLLNMAEGSNKQEYKRKIFHSTDKAKLNIILAMAELKPSASKLLSKLALLSNQKFSKELVALITDSPTTIDDDIYQLSKFALIVNVNTGKSNTIFEMPKVMVEKILEINQYDNKLLLEKIISKINHYANYANDSISNMGTQKRHTKTKIVMLENLEIILRNTEKYQVNIYTEMHLRKNLLVYYMNTQNKYGCKQMIEWFNKQEKNNSFNLWLNKKHKGGYASYLGLIGIYHYVILSRLEPAISYFTRALAVLEDSDEKLSLNLQYNHLSHLAIIQAFLGNTTEAKMALNKMTKLLDRGVDKADIILLYYAKAAIYHTQGRHVEALEYSDKNIKDAIKYGMLPDDLFMTVAYIQRAELLNCLGKYQQAGIQAQQLYNMHSVVNPGNSPIFGSIYTQMARSELGLGKIKLALKHARKAMMIILANDHRDSQDGFHSHNLSLAKAWIVQGDILVAQNSLEEAIMSYRQAQAIYYYLYHDRSVNVAHVSYLYTQGAQASCKARDLYHYKCFGLPQIEQFGVDHFGTIAMLKYCQQYRMDLWAQETDLSKNRLNIDHFKVKTLSN